jgi:hypothetical protein
VFRPFHADIRSDGFAANRRFYRQIAGQFVYLMFGMGRDRSLPAHTQWGGQPHRSAEQLSEQEKNKKRGQQENNTQETRKGDITDYWKEKGDITDY